MKPQTAIIAAAALVLTAGIAQADPIEGTWLRPSTNTTVQYARQGDQFCGTVQSGEYEGKSIGCLKPADKGYEGEVIALDEGKTYRGSASISGDTLKLTGHWGIFRKSEDWKRQ